MPANYRDANFFGAWPRVNNESEPHSISTSPPKSICSTPRSTPYSSRHNSPTFFPSSPVSTSPVSMSPLSTLRRTYSSTFTLIPEDREINVVAKDQPNSDTIHQSGNPAIIGYLLWWPLILLKISTKMTQLVLKFLFSPLSFAAPTFWISALLWVFWKMIEVPVSFISWILQTTLTYGPAKRHHQRTILISCGSTIQTLHLARNFFSSGARVIVFEFEGLFGLARFSKAVSKFYTVPMPTKDSAQDYIAALCDIVEKEKPTYYIPVCATSPSHYDALAKPYLDLLGCSTFIPGLQENYILDDTLEIIKQCKNNGMQLPPFQVVSSKEDLARLYEINWLGPYRNIILATGGQGVLERQKFVLPKNRRDLKIAHEISDERRWVVIRDVPGNHYVTCTTIKDSKVIANVTCLVHPDTRNLIPEENEQIENWLNEFFAKLRVQRPINGHISFRFVKCESKGELLPLGCRVGVSLPYICHTGVHSKVLYKPCPHFSRQNSGPLVEKSGRYWIHDAVLNTLKHPSIDAVGKLIGTVLDKREALFVYWDPLPYCAYYHFQLPFKSVKTFLSRRQAARNMATTFSTPVHVK